MDPASLRTDPSEPADENTAAGRAVASLNSSMSKAVKGRWGSTHK
jgi:hypothetical protein